MRILRLSIALLLSGTALVAAATPALAHAELTDSTPAEGASLPAAPQQIQLTFSEPVMLASDPVTIAGPDGASWTVGQPTVAGAVVTAPVQPAGPVGPYTLIYRVLADDGDPVNGAVRFTIIAAATPTTATTTSPPSAIQSATPQASSTSNSDGGIPVWVWIVGAAVMLAVGLLVALRVARSPRS